MKLPEAIEAAKAQSERTGRTCRIFQTEKGKLDYVISNSRCDFILNKINNRTYTSRFVVSSSGVVKQ